MKISFFTKLSIVSVVLLALWYSLPNYTSIPGKSVNLGLDLQGGAHLVLGVDMPAMYIRAYENLEDEMRGKLRDAGMRYTQLKAVPNGVSLTLLDGEGVSALRKALGMHSRIDIENNGSNQFTVTFSDIEKINIEKNTMAQTVEVLRSRVDEFGVAEPVIQQQGNSHVIVELPGIDDVARAKGIIGRTAQLTFHLVDESATNNGGMIVAPNRLHLFEKRVTADGQKYNIPVVVEKRPSLTGELLTSASQGFDQHGQPAVDITFNARGTDKFGKLSTQNVGKRFAIVLDGTVYSAPVFNEPILGGRAQISGNFTLLEAKDLATVLNAGALPAPISVVEERTIGPSLGADSVQAGFMAIIIGFLAVMLLMFVVYGVYGLAANVALLINVAIIVAVMSVVGFTLTLPGMAGIVLTIGMAVDANVLIFERIKEEVSAKKKPFQALKRGFDSALSTILDANLTTLIAAVVLFSMGSGPVKGFALTLSLGILASMFTAILLTKWLLVIGLHTFKPKKLNI